VNQLDGAEAIQFVALTQESREELVMYEVKGRTASNFQELKEFSISIAIEDGLMSKECVAWDGSWATHNDWSALTHSLVVDISCAVTSTTSHNSSLWPRMAALCGMATQRRKRSRCV
jgi:hypothetical protein